MDSQRAIISVENSCKYGASISPAPQIPKPALQSFANVEVDHQQNEKGLYSGTGCFGAALKHHNAVVQSVAARVRQYADQGEPYRIFHGSSNSTRTRTSTNVLDISTLSDVLYINQEEQWALVEPNVPMDQLVETTLRHGLVPPVVMEFPGITAGGGFSGTSGESSTFRYGFFNETVIEAEIILGNGDIVRASRDEREDLFRAAGGALGTLGIVTLMKLRLVEAKQFVYTRYTCLSSVSEALESIQRTKDDPDVDYLDSMLFSKQHAVVISGQLTNDLPADAEVQTFSGAADPWFYMHVQEQTKGIAPGSVIEEYIPLAEYLFRYDRGAFWVGEQGYTYFKYIPFNSFFRWLLDDFSHTRTLYHALHCTGVSSQFVVQDVAVVYRNAEKMIDFISEELNIWPIWLCPLAPARVPSFHPVLHGVDLGINSGSLSEPMLNIGIYGWGPPNADEFVAKNRAIEEKLSELGGRKWLYAHTFYTETEFWDVYDRVWYESLRLKYHATSLPSVYDKVKPVQKEQRHWTQKVAEMWPIGGLYGMCRAIMSGDYRLHREAKWKW